MIITTFQKFNESTENCCNCKQCNCTGECKCNCCCANKEEQPWYEAEDCETCYSNCEQDNIDYEQDFTWKDGTWICNGCGSPQ